MMDMIAALNVMLAITFADDCVGIYKYGVPYKPFDICEGGGDTLGYWKYTCHDGLPYKDTFSDENCEGKATSNSLDDFLSANCSGNALYRKTNACDFTWFEGWITDGDYTSCSYEEHGVMYSTAFIPNQCGSYQLGNKSECQMAKDNGYDVPCTTPQPQYKSQMYTCQNGQLMFWEWDNDDCSGFAVSVTSHSKCLMARGDCSGAFEMAMKVLCAVVVAAMWRNL